MYQVVETSHKEKVEMYMALSKEQLVEMLIECNKQLQAFCKPIVLADPCARNDIQKVQQI